MTPRRAEETWLWNDWASAWVGSLILVRLPIMGITSARLDVYSFNLSINRVFLFESRCDLLGEGGSLSLSVSCVFRGVAYCWFDKRACLPMSSMHGLSPVQIPDWIAVDSLKDALVAGRDGSID